MGNFHVFLAPLLERTRQSVVHDHSTITLQVKELEEGGLVQQEDPPLPGGSSEEDPGIKENEKFITIDVDIGLQTITSCEQGRCLLTDMSI